MTGFLSDMKRDAIDAAKKQAEETAQAVLKAKGEGVTGKELEHLQEKAEHAKTRFENLSKPKVVEHVHTRGSRVPGGGSGP